ncbi:MAG: hypothetical protein IPM16_04270 [Chloroflexi bacterium]|nr:hypothetical protein [Chloroflexota bacterium]
MAAIAAALALAACAPASQPPRRIALLAPFEGRYREVGYDALYALRLGLADSGSNMIVNAIDISREADVRIYAAYRDPTIVAWVLAGPQLAQRDVHISLRSYITLPSLVLGSWGAPQVAAVYLMAPSNVSIGPAVVPLDTYRWDDDEDHGGDVFALREFARLNPGADPVIVTAAALPDEALARRIKASGLFVPEPRLHASLAYDAGLFLGGALADADTRADALEAVLRYEVEGYNGTIAFDPGGWRDAPVHRYRVTGETLVKLP